MTNFNCRTDTVEPVRRVLSAFAPDHDLCFSVVDCDETLPDGTPLRPMCRCQFQLFPSKRIHRKRRTLERENTLIRLSFLFLTILFPLKFAKKDIRTPLISEPSNTSDVIRTSSLGNLAFQMPRRLGCTDRQLLKPLKGRPVYLRFEFSGDPGRTTLPHKVIQLRRSSVNFEVQTFL